MIDRATIEKIIDAAEITEVIQEFVSLKKRGVNYLGLCPFHNEKTPSFIVSPSKGIFKCFGCGKAGNAVNFIMEHERLSYPEALKYLAKRYHIEVVEKELTAEETAKQNERESLLILTGYASRQFSQNLFSSDEGMAIGLSYFKERGFRQETLKKFEVGYSFEKYDAFSRQAMDDGYSKDFLIQTGLSVQHEDKLFDRFRGRVMFPIHSLSGQVLGFGGRVLKTDGKLAKYLNSPESEIYHKSRILYGIYQARKAITQFDRCYLVEGYTDVMSLHEAGVENVVASSGTSLTIEQVRLIKRFTPNVTILYDGDAAGIKASLRGIDIVLEEGLNVKIVLLPDSEDPDSYSKKISNEEFKAFLKEKETDFIHFKTDLLLRDTKNDPVGRATVIRDIVKSIAVIPDAITRTIYIKECSSQMEMPEEILYQEVGKLRQQKTFQDRNKYPDRQDLPTTPKLVQKDSTKETDSLFFTEQELVRLLLKYGSNEYERISSEGDNQEEVVTIAEFIVREIVSDELMLDNPLFEKIFEEYKFATEQGTFIEESKFIKNIDPQISEVSANLLSEPHVISEIWRKKQVSLEGEEMRLQKIVSDAVYKFKGDKINNRSKEVLQLMQEADKEGDREKQELLMKRFFELRQVLGVISAKTGGRIRWN